MNQSVMLKRETALLVSDGVHHKLRLRGLSSHLLFSFSENCDWHHCAACS